MLLNSAAIALTLAATVATSSCGQAAKPSTPASSEGQVTPDQPSVTRLLTATTSGFDEHAELVLRDEAALAAAWRTAHGGVPGNPAPAVDFQRRMVVLLALGTRRTGGYAVHFDGMKAEGHGAVVRYTITSPGPGCMTTQMVTSPVDAVSVARVDGTVVFEKTEATDHC